MKRFGLKKTLFVVSFGVIFFGVLIHSVSAENFLQPKTVLFKTTDEKLDMAKELKADILVPKTFQEGMFFYREAEEMYKNNEEQDEIKKIIKNARQKFQKAIDETKVSGVLFTETMLARDDTIKVSGHKIDTENWNQAEETFKDAAMELEDGDSDDAKSLGKEAELLYRKAELKAIQTKFLKETWSLLKHAENMDVDRYAPITINKARNLAKKSAALLHLHRYDQKEAEQLALQAEYEARHAVYMTKIIKPLQTNNSSFESVFLHSEEPIQKIASSLSVSAPFDNGFEIPVKNITDKINKLKKDNSQLSELLKKDKSDLSDIINQKNIELSGLKEKINYLETRLNQLASSEEKLKFEIEQEKIRKEKIKRISASFSPSEGKALLDGKNVIIRLYGLNFPSGKSVIEPQFFSLLSKVKNSFSEFPGCLITIEGHTDSIGSDEINQRLSEERAEAVRQYIIANSNISWDRITSVGYGERNPVASNETVEGQTKNRRIDVVIQPITN
jgi:outer membrane protein OmpA-like peptidoglycan-associated protein